MPRTKIDYAFTGEVIDSTHPTASGRWYAEYAIDDIVKSVIDGKKYIIQEYSPLEREIKKIRADMVWTETIMGTCIAAEKKDGKLLMTFKCASNKYGKRLKNLCESIGIRNLNLFPVGRGIARDVSGKPVVSDYDLIYIAI